MAEPNEVRELENIRKKVEGVNRRKNRRMDALAALICPAIFLYIIYLVGSSYDWALDRVTSGAIFFGIPPAFIALVLIYKTGSNKHLYEFNLAIVKWDAAEARRIHPNFEHDGDSYRDSNIFDSSGFAPDYDDVACTRYNHIKIDAQVSIHGYHVYATKTHRWTETDAKGKTVHRSRTDTVFDGSVYEMSTRERFSGFLTLTRGNIDDGNVRPASGFVRDNYCIQSSDILKAHQILSPVYCQNLEAILPRVGFMKLRYRGDRLFVSFPRQCSMSLHPLDQPVTEQVLADRSKQLRIFFELLKGIQADFGL